MCLQPHRVSAAPARKNGDAVLGRNASKIVATRGEIIPNRAVRCERLAIAVHDLVKMLESDAGQSFRLMRLIDAKQIVQAPHALGEFCLGDDPSTAQSAETVDLS